MVAGFQLYPAHLGWDAFAVDTWEQRVLVCYDTSSLEDEHLLHGRTEQNAKSCNDHGLTDVEDLGG